VEKRIQLFELDFQMVWDNYSTCIKIDTRENQNTHITTKIEFIRRCIKLIVCEFVFQVIFYLACCIKHFWRIKSVKSSKVKKFWLHKTVSTFERSKIQKHKSIRLLIKEKDSGCIKVINVESLFIFEKNITSPIDFFKSGLAFLNNGFTQRNFKILLDLNSTHWRTKWI